MQKKIRTLFCGINIFPTNFTFFPPALALPKTYHEEVARSDFVSCMCVCVFVRKKINSSYEELFDIFSIPILNISSKCFVEYLAILRYTYNSVCAFSHMKYNFPFIMLNEDFDLCIHFLDCFL